MTILAKEPAGTKISLCAAVGSRLHTLVSKKMIELMTYPWTS